MRFSRLHLGNCDLPTLMKMNSKGGASIFASKEACRQCPNRCTSSKNRKEVSFGPDTKAVPVSMYGSPGKKLNPLSKGIVLYNSFDRKGKHKKQVLLRIKGAPEKIPERMCLSEHPFGTVKWHGRAHYLLCNGKEKATAEPCE